MIKLLKEQKELRWSLAVYFLGIIYAVYLTKNLWATGILLNGEHSVFLSLLRCFEESNSWLLTGFWCQYLPQFNSTYSFFPPLFSIITLLFSIVLPIEVAYKLTLVISWLFIPTTVFILFAHTKKYYAAASTFLLTLFLTTGIGNFGFEYIVLWGGAQHALGWGLLMINTVLGISFFRQPTKKKIVGLTVVTALLLLAHFLIFMFFPIVLIILAIKYHDATKKHIKPLAFYAILVGLIASFWLLPFAIKTTQLRPLGMLVGDFSKVVSPFETLQKIWEGSSSLSVIFLIAGIIGLACYGLKKDILGESVRIFGVMFLIVLLLGLVKGLNALVVPVRLVQLFPIAIAIGAGMLIELLAIEAKPYRKLLALSILLAVLVPEAEHVGAKSEYLFTTQDARIGFKVADWYKELGGKISETNERIIVEDSYDQLRIGNKQPNVKDILASTRLFVPAAVLLKKEMIFIYSKDVGKSVFIDVIPWYAYFTQGEINTTTQKQVEGALNAFNSGFVLSKEPTWSAASQMPVVWTLKVMDANITLREKQGEPHYFSGVDTEAYYGTKAEAQVKTDKTRKITFKQGFWPNWKAYVNGIQTKIGMNEVGFMTVEVQPGSHKVEFAYERLWHEVLGVVLTVLGLVLLGTAIKYDFFVT